MPTIQIPAARVTVVSNLLTFTTTWFRWAVNMTNAPGVQLSYSGNGSPEGVVIAPIGAFYSRKDGAVGTTFYIKEADAGLNTGWRAL